MQPDFKLPQPSDFTPDRPLAWYQRGSVTRGVAHAGMQFALGCALNLAVLALVLPPALWAARAIGGAWWRLWLGAWP